MTTETLPAQTEAAFQAQVIDLARICGWCCYHTFDSRRSSPGFPDLVLVRGEELRFVELKTDRGRCTSAQDEWLDRLTAIETVSTALWRPRDWDGIVEALR